MTHRVRTDLSTDSHIKIVPGRMFNAWPQSSSWMFNGRNVAAGCNHTEMFYLPGDFAVHFVAGHKNELTAYLEEQV